MNGWQYRRAISILQDPVLSYPFRPEVSVWLEVEGRDVDFVAIYDMSGKEVKRLRGENITSGNVLYHWNGRDANAAPAPNGVYNIVAITKSGLLKGNS